ncbi:phasin family protein [Zavarzinia sp. CC-PAN008]|uniref:phasin family protein n=1 Tax=Zavarzinia sp. CC-PAN008 TaxID=3243332 RepID=UPI003F745B72
MTIERSLSELVPDAAAAMLKPPFMPAAATPTEAMDRIAEATRSVVEKGEEATQAAADTASRMVRSGAESTGTLAHATHGFFDTAVADQVETMQRLMAVRSMPEACRIQAEYLNRAMERWFGLASQVTQAMAGRVAAAD